MSNLYKKLALIILSSLLLFNSVMAAPLLALAQEEPEPPASSSTSSWYNQDPFAWYLKVFDYKTSPASEIFGERYTAAQVQWILYSLGWGIVNLVPGNPEIAVCLINKEPTGICFDIAINILKKLANPLATNLDSNIAYKNSLINSILNNQISGVSYFKQQLAKFNMIKTANAQGYGFNTGANAVQKLWQATRNLSYALIVLAVIVMSFMIMFRIKISPQVVISVQSALPNIVATTVLITFSYAIAGFAIDLMYVVIGLISQLLISGGLTNLNFSDMFGSLNTSYVGGMFYLMYAYWVAFVVNAFMAFVANLSSAILGIIIFIFAILSILMVIFWSLKIIYVLLKNFALVMLTIATGPLQILAGSFTGKSSFGSWFRKLLSYLAVYPVMGLMIFFSFFFLVQGGMTSGSTFAISLFGNPTVDYIGNNTWRPPFSGFALADNILWVVVSFVVFSNVTKASEIIQSAIAGKPFSFGSAIGEATQIGGNIAEAGGDIMKQSMNPLIKVGGTITKNMGEIMKILGKVG